VKQSRRNYSVPPYASGYDPADSFRRETLSGNSQGAASALILDGMGIPKQGDESVGVGRQWCGATGKMDNCQTTVNLTLANPGDRRNADQVSWPLGMRLFLPRKWVSDAPSVYDSEHQKQRYAERRKKAALPDDINYQSKHDIAAELVEEAAESGFDFGCVLGDSNFGKSTKLRGRLRELQTPYALEVVPSKFPMLLGRHRWVRSPNRGHPAPRDSLEDLRRCRCLLSGGPRPEGRRQRVGIHRLGGKN